MTGMVDAGRAQGRAAVTHFFKRKGCPIKFVMMTLLPWTIKSHYRKEPARKKVRKKTAAGVAARRT